MMARRQSRTFNCGAATHNAYEAEEWFGYVQVVRERQPRYDLGGMESDAVL